MGKWSSSAGGYAFSIPRIWNNTFPTTDSSAEGGLLGKHISVISWGNACFSPFGTARFPFSSVRDERDATRWARMLKAREAEVNKPTYLRQPSVFVFYFSQPPSQTPFHNPRFVFSQLISRNVSATAFLSERILINETDLSASGYVYYTGCQFDNFSPPDISIYYFEMS